MDFHRLCTDEYVLTAGGCIVHQFKFWKNISTEEQITVGSLR